MYSSPFSKSAARLSLVLSMGLAGLAPAAGLVPAAFAQANPACQPPRSGEYLLMVMNPTEDIQTQLRQVLPPSSTATVCDYLQDRVLRVDGFSTPELASSWAQYVETKGGESFIARPAGAAATPTAPETAAAPSFPQPTLPVTPAPTTTPIAPAPVAVAPMTTAPMTTAPTAAATATGAYPAQPLGTGYAVLVDYFNRPETAIELQQLLSRQIGLVSYGQRPYLLAVYTTDAAVANSTLQSLSDRNFTALIIDSRRAVLLTPAVAVR
jgi:cell division septation protein DedD